MSTRRHRNIGWVGGDMENFWENSLDANGGDRGMVPIGDAVDTWRADDPLGDEAAFPMTWQHLAGDAAQD